MRDGRVLAALLLLVLIGGGLIVRFDRVKEETPNPGLDTMIEQEMAQLKGLMEADQPYSTMARQLIEPLLEAGAT